MTDRRRFSRLLIAIVAWWALYGLMMASQIVNLISPVGVRLTWSGALEYAYASMWLWIPMTSIAYLLARRYPLGRKNLWRNLLIHAAVVAFFILCKGIYAYHTSEIFGWYKVLPPLHEVLDTSVRHNLTLGWMVVGLAHGLVYYEHTEDRERKMAELERSLVSTRLDALRAQLNPHFLFNALNSVAELMQIDVDQADRMLVAICEMLRDGLRTHDLPERPLKEELRQLKNYLTIEGIRLGERMSSSIEADEACMEVPVPVLSLQPVVENAIIHSIARTRAPGWVRVSCWVDELDLHVMVANSASAVVESRKDGTGVGLRSVSDRLSLLYGSRGQIHRIESDKDVYRVHIVVPMPGTRSLGV